MALRLRDIGRGNGRRDVIFIDPRIIKIESGFNPRSYSLAENREHLDALKVSIVENGVLVPLLVRWNGEEAILIDGECRLRASLELIEEGVEIKAVPVIQEDGDSEAARLVIALAANTGKPLSLLEAGAAYKRLERFGWSHEEIAKKVGVTRAKVASAIEIAEAPIEVKQMVQDGSVTPALAKKAVREKGDKAAADLIHKVEKAKAAGKTTAKRERIEKEPAMGQFMPLWIDIGDEMAKAILDDPELNDTPVSGLAMQWAKARGL